LPGTTSQLQGIDQANTNYVYTQGYNSPVGTLPTYGAQQPNYSAPTYGYGGGSTGGGVAYSAPNVVSGTQPLQPTPQLASGPVYASPTGYYYGSPYGGSGQNNSDTLDITAGSLPGGATSYY